MSINNNGSSIDLPSDTRVSVQLGNRTYLGCGGMCYDDRVKSYCRTSQKKFQSSSDSFRESNRRYHLLTYEIPSSEVNPA